MSEEDCRQTVHMILDELLTFKSEFRTFRAEMLEFKAEMIGFKTETRDAIADTRIQVREDMALESRSTKARLVDIERRLTALESRPHEGG